MNATSPASMLKCTKRMLDSGVKVIILLALCDEGKPFYDVKNATAFSSLGVPTFACTPDRFPDLIAYALASKEPYLWVRSQRIALK